MVCDVPAPSLQPWLMLLCSLCSDPDTITYSTSVTTTVPLLLLFTTYYVSSASILYSDLDDADLGLRGSSSSRGGSGSVSDSLGGDPSALGLGT
jgi:hypothetical protein